jgi:phosphopantetheine--protein transferase-like protein
MHSTNSFQLICFEQETVFIEKDKLQPLLFNADLFSVYERKYCQKKSNPLLSIAGLWCVKQAFIKATYKLRVPNFNTLDLQIIHHPSGQPVVLLRDSLARWFEEKNIAIEVSIAHTSTLATAALVFWSYRK